MSQITQLRRTLQPLLDWHGARITFLALFLIALFRVKTVNLAELATAFATQTKPELNYKRMQRFLRLLKIDYFEIAQVVVALIEMPKPYSRIGVALEWGSIAQNQHCVSGFAASALKSSCGQTPTLGTVALFDRLAT